jgi:nucleotide-binding universal stress UspA family protein
MKVLIATDGSNEATAALQTAARLLNPVDRQVDLLSVAPRFSRRSQNRTRTERYQERALSETTQILERARAKFPPSARAVTLLTAIGSPSGVIVKKAEDYDLIGPKGRGTTGAVGLGPVASRVVEHALAPVLVARELRSDDGIRVLVAVDGSEASLKAVETIGAFFDLAAAEVCLMHVAETPWVELGLEDDWVTYSEEDKEASDVGALEKELVREGDAVVEQARDLVRPYRASVTTRFEEGNPANEILSEAERGQYDLVVVGATGARDLKHRMLGSVSSKIAWNAPCSVLIVRAPE